MKSTIVSILVVIVAATGAWYVYSKGPGAAQYANTQDLGMYPYVCDNGSTFTLSPLEGLKTVQVSADSQGMFTGTATLALVSGTTYSGTAPDKQTVMLMGDGETVHLTVGSGQATCSPKANPDSAPWNWGDASTTTTSASSKASVTWSFTDAGEVEAIPYSNVTVAVNGTTYQAGKFIGSCTELGASGGIDGKGLLAGELSAAQCWFAGGGSEVGVFANEAGGYDIMVGSLSEGEEGAPLFRGDFKIKTTIK